MIQEKSIPFSFPSVFFAYPEILMGLNQGFFLEFRLWFLQRFFSKFLPVFLNLFLSPFFLMFPIVRYLGR